MKTNFFYRYIFLAIITSICCAGCEKFLDDKPKASLAIPNTLKAFQAILDQTTVMYDTDASAGEVSAGDSYVTDADYLTRSEEEKRMYVWGNAYIFAPQINDWYNTYSVIYRANTVINGIDKVELNSLNATEWNNVKGQAHYYRAKSLLNAVLIWAKIYDPLTAKTDLGVPLKLSTNFNEPTERAVVEECYEQVVSDLKEAIRTLTIQPLHVVRTSKPAAYGLLSRTLLIMGKYNEAILYADSSLQLRSDLLDFNSLNPSAAYPIAAFNKEVITGSKMVLSGTINPSRAKIVPELYESYETNDLRKVIFFRTAANNSYSFKGSYEGTANLFSGVATNEIYLIKAEGLARVGRVSEALATINILLNKRYKKGTFSDMDLTDSKELLQIILKERRKELLFRGLRWGDIKRLNRDGAGIELKRIVNGNVYTINANSARFALPIPEVVVSLSGMQQNIY